MAPNRSFWEYGPSTEAAWVFTILFAISTALHLAQIIIHRTYFFIPFLIGGFFEVIGFAMRILSIHNPTNRPTYIVTTLLVLLAPVLFAATLYMQLSRLTPSSFPRRRRRRRHLFTSTFVAGDILSLVVQAVGGTIMVSNLTDRDRVKLGSNIIVGGLVIQLVFLGSFVLVAAWLAVKSRRAGRERRAGAKHPRGGERVDGSGPEHNAQDEFDMLPSAPSQVGRDEPARASTPGWVRRGLAVLYLGVALVLVRSVFRMIEYVGGRDGYLIRHEVFFYVFDAFLMIIVMVAFNVVYPGPLGRRGEESVPGGGKRWKWGVWRE